MNSLVDNLGPALRALRKARSLKQKKVADLAGITNAMLSAYETGKRNPSMKTLECLLEALGVSLRDLHYAVSHVQEARNRGLDVRRIMLRLPEGTPKTPAGTGVVKREVLLQSRVL